MNGLNAYLSVALVWVVWSIFRVRASSKAFERAAKRYQEAVRAAAAVVDHISSTRQPAAEPVPVYRRRVKML